LSAHLKEKEEKLQQLLAALAEESAYGVPIMVEGKKDDQALRALGINGPVLMLKTGGKAFADMQEEIEKSGAREVILLFDFDRRGKEVPNLQFWRALKALVGREVQCIEGLTAYVENLKLRTGKNVTA
jgi:5S rRNA maturation endonuclease (ribonuclease M5)